MWTAWPRWRISFLAPRRLPPLSIHVYLSSTCLGCMACRRWSSQTMVRDSWASSGRKCSLFLGTDLLFSTAFHLETDGQSEVTICVLENFLWPYTEHRPSTWTAQLPLVEFAANNAINVSTWFTPFYLNSGQHLVIPTMLLACKQPKSSNEAVKEALEQMKIALTDTQTNLYNTSKKWAVLPLG